MEKRILITAGSTREPIDQVRQWSNIFTGNTGLAIARAMAKVGQVDFLTSNSSHIQTLAAEHSTISTAAFSSHEDLKNLLTKKMREQKYEAVIMTAAVSDYRSTGAFEIISRGPQGDLETWTLRKLPDGDKISSAHQSIAFTGEPTEKLIDLFRTAWNFRGLLIKFKLEVGISREELIKIGEKSRLRSRAQYLVANTLDMVEGPAAGAFLLGSGGAKWIARDSLPQTLAGIVLAAD